MSKPYKEQRLDEIKERLTGVIDSLDAAAAESFLAGFTVGEATEHRDTDTDRLEQVFSVAKSLGELVRVSTGVEHV